MALLPSPNAPLSAQLAALRGGVAVYETSDRVLRVRGDDRVDWLSGMVTNETRSLRPGGGRYTAVVHTKGKLLADAWVYAREDELLLVVPGTTTAALREHFERYIVMEDVAVEAADELRVLAVQGAGARAALPPDGRAAFASERLGSPGVDWLLPADAGAEVLAWMARAGAVAVDDAAWEVCRLEAGIPRFGRDFDEQNYVQEAALSARAVSTQKGCYVGQEVVCRLEVRGHARRQLVALAVPGEVPAPGTPALSGGLEAGAVTSGAWSPEQGQSVVLAMLKWDVVSRGAPVEIAGRPAVWTRRPS